MTENMQQMDAASAEKLLRSLGAQAAPELVALVMQKYFDNDDVYRAYALLSDYDSLGEEILNFPFDGPKKQLLKELRGFPLDGPKGRLLKLQMFAVFCKNEDRRRSLRTALQIIDLYPELTLMAAASVVQYFKAGQGDVPMTLILKPAVTAALEILSGTEEMSERTAALIWNVMICLPYLNYDAEFFREKAAAFRSLSSRPLSSDRAALVQKLNERFREAYLTIHASGVEPSTFKALAGAPEGIPHHAPPEGLQLVKRAQQLWPSMREGEEPSPAVAAAFAELARDLNEALKKEKNAALRDDMILLLLDMLLEGEKYPCLQGKMPDIAPWLPEFNRLCDRKNRSDREYLLLSSILARLSGYYFKKSDDAMTMLYSVRYLRCSCDRFKQILVERGPDAFAENLRFSIPHYDAALSRAFWCLNRDPQNPLEKALYLQLSRHKNLLYTAEMRLHGCAGEADLLRLLDDDYKLPELFRALPEDAVLVDFCYSALRSSGFHMTSEEKSKAACNAFVIDANGGFTGMTVGKASHFAAYLAGPDVPGSYQQYLCHRGEWEAWLQEQNRRYPDGRFPDGRETDARKALAAMTHELLQGYETKKRIFVSTEGDFNSVSFLSLPYGDGFIADHFAVRNVAGIYDLIHPRYPTGGSRALILSAPEYGFGELDLPYLNGSEQEGVMTALMLRDGSGMTVDTLFGMDATKKNLLGLLEKHTYRILHFSTHGSVRDKRMCMALTGANESEEGLLWEDQLSEAIKGGADTAVLNLCFAGKTDTAVQNSLSGFVKVMLLSGVGTVVAPISPVNDMDCLALTAAFYEKYVTENLPAEEALQQAICHIRKRPSDGGNKQPVGAPPLTDSKAAGAAEEDRNGASAADDTGPEAWAQWVCYSAAADGPAPGAADR